MGLFPEGQAVKSVVLIAIWYSCSALANTINKGTLNLFPYPITVALAQLLGINLILPITQYFRSKSSRGVISMEKYLRWIIPLSVLRVLASISSQVTILSVPVSYAHTVKAMTPICTVLFSRLLLRTAFSLEVYLSLVPIMFGILLASATEVEFNVVGLLSAMFATSGFALQSIFSKKLMSEGHIQDMALLQSVSRTSFFVMLPVWYLRDYSDENFIPRAVETIGNDWNDNPFVLMAGNALCNSCQSIAAFSFLSMVSPVGYSVASVMKRMVIISFSMLIFRNEVSAINVLGMMIAISGVGMYNGARMNMTSKLKVSLAASEILSPTVTNERDKVFYDV